MEGDEKKPLFVFRPRSADRAGDYSQDLVADIEQISETHLWVIDAKRQRQQLLITDYRLFQAENVQYALIDVHLDQSRWLLADIWKQYGEEGYEIAYYDRDAIQEATAEAKRLNATSVHPTWEQTFERLRQLMGELRRYQHDQGNEGER